MAWALSTGTYLANMTFEDEAGNQVQRAIEVPFDTDASTTLGNIPAILDDWKAISGAQIVTASVTLYFADSTPKTPISGSEVENQASISVDLDELQPNGQPQNYTFVVPAPELTIFVAATGPSKNVVDVSDALVMGLVDNYETTGDATVANGKNVVAINGGKRTHRKSSKG